MQLAFICNKVFSSFFKVSGLSFGFEARRFCVALTVLALSISVQDDCCFGFNRSLR